MEKALCRPCMEKIVTRKGYSVKPLPMGSGKITCDECNRRRYGRLYEVKRVFRNKEAAK